MHWLRIERYWEGEFPDARLSFRPVMCQQCDAAPCEPVCPTYASHHTEEGLNAQVYNRCIGTRYCANACPYNVRFFNFFNPGWDKPLHLQFNPDVSVREIGVMEKCTFCVQRIKATEQLVEAENRPMKDGELKPACVQSCIATAMVFGDLNDPESQVSRLARSPRGEKLLEDVGAQAERDLSEAAGAGMSASGQRINDDLLRPLLETTWRFYLLVAVLGLCVLAGAGSFAVPGLLGHRRVGSQVAHLLGVRHHELRVLDRHQPRGHADLGHSAPGQRDMAAAGHAVRGSHHGLRADDRRDVPNRPSRPAWTVLLADAVSD